LKCRAGKRLAALKIFAKIRQNRVDALEKGGASNEAAL